MISPRARRGQDLALVVLTASTGAVDAISWLRLGKVFSAFMTGNFVFLALRTAGAAGPSAPRVLASLVPFAIGALVAGRVVGRPGDARGLWPARVTATLGAVCVVQAVFLAVWVGVDARPSGRAGDLLIALSAFAMGSQTSAVLCLGLRAVFTTAATGTWAVLMGDLSGWPQSAGERRRLLAVIVGLVTGAVAGALLVLHAATWAPVVPLVLSTVVVAAAARSGRPRAAVRRHAGAWGGRWAPDERQGARDAGRPRRPAGPGPV